MYYPSLLALAFGVIVFLVIVLASVPISLALCASKVIKPLGDSLPHDGPRDAKSAD